MCSDNEARVINILHVQQCHILLVPVSEGITRHQDSLEFDQSHAEVDKDAHMNRKAAEAMHVLRCGEPPILYALSLCVQ